MSAPESHWVIGIHPVTQVLMNQAQQIQQLYVLQGQRNQRLEKLVNLARQYSVRIQEYSKTDLDKLTGEQRHQGVVACCEVSNLLVEKDLGAVLQSLPQPFTVLILDGVQDPHNLGACLRSAAAAGVGLVIIPKDKAVGITPVVRRAAAGAAESIPILQATNLARVLERLKQAGIWLVGTTDHAESTIYQLDLSGNLGLIMGSEAKGMRRLTEQSCDYLARIPMQGTVSSLNVSVATGVCLFELLRQRTNEANSR